MLMRASAPTPGRAGQPQGKRGKKYVEIEITEIKLSMETDVSPLSAALCLHVQSWMNERIR